MPKFIRQVQAIVIILVKEKIFTLVLFVLAFICLGAGLVFVFESSAKSGAFSDYFDAIWWAIVTVTTVGYGDKIPQAALGRIVAGFLMFSGITLMSILSGTIASIIVNRSLREGRGLENITDKKHLIVCGWNRNAEKLLVELHSVYVRLKESIVLINEMSAEDFQSLNTKYSDINLRFVRGDYVNEKVLKKANIEQARAVILLADEGGREDRGNADERTILAAFTIKSLNSDVMISAEVFNPENEPHLKRANVDNILVNGEFNSFLFAHGARQKGITRAVKEMLSTAGSNTLAQCDIPQAYVGKSFQELSENFLRAGKGVLLGFLSQEKKMSIDDILSADTSAIDSFILRKFQEADIDLAEEQKEELQIRLNPGSDYVIKDTDIAFVIGGKR
jgi:voltage-gated potassium channel